MDRISLDEQLELLRGDEPDVADARRMIVEDKRQADRSRRIQAFDAAVGPVVREVAAPVGLADRILDRIGRESATETHRRRRNYVVGGIGAAIALTLMICVSVWRWPDPTWTSDRVAAEAAKAFRHAGGWPGPNASTPPFPAVGLRGALIGFQAFPFLKKPANGFKLAAPSGEYAAAIVVDAAWFPADFDFSATYSVSGNDDVEVRFLPVPGGDEVCIFVARDPRQFEKKALIF